MAGQRQRASLMAPIHLAWILFSAALCPPRLGLIPLEKTVVKLDSTNLLFFVDVEFYVSAFGIVKRHCYGKRPPFIPRQVRLFWIGKAQVDVPPRSPGRERAICK